MHIIEVGGKHVTFVRFYGRKETKDAGRISQVDPNGTDDENECDF
jgi:hypothetical protein